ncbi:putative DNA-directed RNA polymerase [Lupinus albus]|uniref:DNA-directed RNA polymerase n=1 Tax=Lupinus albus TaxID=3870 RepID=A0A6A4QCF2_LUPAL|nr:putative DNA-directed RNA polymerase [Lupinus albus]
MVATGNSSALNRRMREEQIVPTRYRQEFLTIAWEEVHLGIPLSRSERCIVGNRLEHQVALDLEITVIAEYEGKIIYTDTDNIILLGNGDTLSIPLVMYERSNKNTCMHKKPQVQRGKCIKKGQILADGAATVGRELAFGKNILVDYMP